MCHKVCNVEHEQPIFWRSNKHADICQWKEDNDVSNIRFEHQPILFDDKQSGTLNGK